MNKGKWRQFAVLTAIVSVLSLVAVGVGVSVAISSQSSNDSVAGVGTDDAAAKTDVSVSCITIFLADNATEGDVSSLTVFIKGIEDVATVVYVSKDQALERFKEMTSADIIEALDGNPLPASLEVYLNEGGNFGKTAESIASSDLFIKVADEPGNPSRSISY